MNNLGLKKKMLGEVDVFQLDSTHELYGHLNINYVHLPYLPSYDNYGQLLDAGMKPSELVVFRYDDQGVAVLEDGLYVLQPALADPDKITATNAYEVNIWDDRPEKDYGTGAIVGLAKVDPMPTATGKWNVYEITAKGGVFTVVLNGKQTVEGKDGKFASGRIALQHGLGNKDAAGVANDKGVVKFRKVEIKKL